MDDSESDLMESLRISDDEPTPPSTLSATIEDPFAEVDDPLSPLTPAPAIGGDLSNLESPTLTPAPTPGKEPPSVNVQAPTPTPTPAQAPVQATTPAVMNPGEDEAAKKAAAEEKKRKNKEKFLAERKAMQDRMKKKQEESKPPAPAPVTAPTPPALGPAPAPHPNHQVPESGVALPSPPPQQVLPRSLSQSSIYSTPSSLPFKSVHVDGCEHRKIGGFFGASTFWAYKIVVNSTQFVVRRFRDVVALEKRIRDACPGIILPPSPDKHRGRAVEEGTTQQSAEFAQARSHEISNYLQGLIELPMVNNCEPLKVFLTLQDDIGTAWEEVSTSAVTRLTASATASANKSALNASYTMNKLNSNEVTDSDPKVFASTQDQLEIISSIHQAVPKLENASVLFREQGERMGDCGMELTKLVNDIKHSDPTTPIQLLSNSILRGSRRTKRESVEIAAALQPYSYQYRLCDYIKLAIGDRKRIIARRHSLNRRHEEKTLRLRMQKTSPTATTDSLRKLELETKNLSAQLSNANDLQNDMGLQILSEFTRVNERRRDDFGRSTKIIASSMLEAARERRAIWEDAKRTFEAEFDE